MEKDSRQTHGIHGFTHPETVTNFKSRVYTYTQIT